MWIIHASTSSFFEELELYKPKLLQSNNEICYFYMKNTIILNLSIVIGYIVLHTFKILSFAKIFAIEWSKIRNYTVHCRSELERLGVCNIYYEGTKLIEREKERERERENFTHTKIIHFGTRVSQTFYICLRLMKYVTLK